MKKIILTSLVFLLTIVSVFANTTIDFSSDKKNYNIEDTIHLSIKIDTTNTWSTELNIEWIDDFQVVGQSKRQSQININWNITSSFILQLSLLAQKSWKFTLWPISSGSGSSKVQSETIEIKITGERIMVNNQLKAPKRIDDSEEENIDDVDLNNKDAINDSSKSIKIDEKKITWVDWEQMKDIYKNKWFLNWDLFSKNAIIFLILSVLGIIWYYIYYKYIIPLIISPWNKETIKDEEIVQKIEINYSELLKKLEKKYIDSPKEKFYAKTSELLRIFLDDRVQKWLSKWSLKEVEKFLSDSNLENKDTILWFYKNIYFPEYSKWDDNIENRKTILQDLENIIIEREFK